MDCRGNDDSGAECGCADAAGDEYQQPDPVQHGPTKDREWHGGYRHGGDQQACFQRAEPFDQLVALGDDQLEAHDGEDGGSGGDHSPLNPRLRKMAKSTRGSVAERIRRIWRRTNRVRATPPMTEEISASGRLRGASAQVLRARTEAAMPISA